MDERSDQIEEHINRTRGDLSKNVNELQAKVKSTFDWRAQVQERPLMMLGLALGGGILAAALVTRRGGRGDRRGDYASRASWRAEDLEPTYRSKGKKGTAPVIEFLGVAKGALVTAVASRIGGLLGQVFASYREELRNRSRRKNYDERDERYPSQNEASRRPH